MFNTSKFDGMRLAYTIIILVSLLSFLGMCPCVLFLMNKWGFVKIFPRLSLACFIFKNYPPPPKKK